MTFYLLQTPNIPYIPEILYKAKTSTNLHLWPLIRLVVVVIIVYSLAEENRVTIVKQKLQACQMK